MKQLILTFSLLTCGDSITTHAALSMGAQEQNPIQHAFVLDALHGLEVVAISTEATKAHETHPMLTKSILVGLVAMEATVLVSNIHQMQVQNRYNQAQGRTRR